MRRHSLANLFGTVAAVALLAGCASKPQVSAQIESHRYRTHANRSYTPPGPSSDPWGPYIQEASAKYDVPEKWIREVMRQESGGNLYNRGGELITSGAGAMGLMQVMPATYDDLRSRYSELGDDPYDPHNNVLAGAAYLREMYDIYGAPGFLAAYNAGPGRLDDYLTRNRTLPAETRRYVASIGPRIAGYEPQRTSPGAQYAMNAIPLDIPAGPRYQDGGTQFASTVPTPASRPIVLNRPVEVAEAPRYQPAPVVVAEARPAEQFIRLNRPQPEPVSSGPFIKLNPPAPAPAPAPMMVAQAEPPSRYIRLAPQAETDPVESVLGAARRSQQARSVEMPIPEPPTPPEPRAVQVARRGGGSARPIEVAEFAEPRHIPGQRFAAASELVPLTAKSHGFSFIPSANAAPVHAPRFMPAVATSGGGAWAVQVGAFANESQAHSATAAARGRAQDVLGSARTVVAGVHGGGGTLYRARLGGLSREAATEACERLSRARTNCMVVSPDAQR